MQAAARASGASEPRTPLGKPYRVLVVDDHAVVRRGLRSLLASQAGIEVCGEASTGIEAMEIVKKSKPDLVIMDLTMPDMNGLETSRAVKDASPETEVIVLTMHFSDELAREVLRAGAIGYVLKSDADSELLAAVDHARHHQLFFTSQLALTMAQNFVGGTGEGGQEGGPGSPLTPREIEVVQLLAEGKSNKEVAAALNVSTRTIESHRNHIMTKMKFASFSELVRYAVRNNLVEP
ncbi:MAG: response regulator transcription factor [Acidobacteriia bacterium]|nr:response regulator transcription factor [Terriglobia bacterium]